MNPTKMIASLVLQAASLTVLAQGPEYVEPATDFVSSKSRAEVMEELRQARAEDDRVGAESYPGEKELLMARSRGVRPQQELALESKPEFVVSGR